MSRYCISPSLCCLNAQKFSCISLLSSSTWHFTFFFSICFFLLVFHHMWEFNVFIVCWQERDVIVYMDYTVPNNSINTSNKENTKQPTKQKIWKTARNIQIRLSNFILNMRYNLNHSINNVEFFFKSQNVLWIDRIRCDLCCTSHLDKV